LKENARRGKKRKGNPVSRVDVIEQFAPIQREAAQRTEENKTDGIPTISIVMSTCGLASGAAETKPISLLRPGSFPLAVLAIAMLNLWW
jgi:hypothetical protein